MKRYASVRFGAVLARSECESAARVVRSAGAAVTSWSSTSTRTYLTVEADPDAAARLALALPAAAVDVPALAVLRIRPGDARALGRLTQALGGEGRPGGVREAYRDEAALVVELDTARTRLGLLVALIDAELGAARGRTVEPLVALDDAALAAFAGDLLGLRDLDASRLVEPYVEAIVAESPA